MRNSGQAGGAERGLAHVNWRKVAWYKVAISLAATFALLVAGTGLVRRQGVDRPLLNAVRRVSGVLEAKTAVQGDQTVVTVRLGEVPDLQATYRSLDQAVQSVRGVGSYRLLVTDDRTPWLSEAYYRLHYGLQEGNATGRFTRMAETVQRGATTMGLQRYRLYVDKDRIYLALYQDGHYLYEVLPRQVPVTGERGAGG